MNDRFQHIINSSKPVLVDFYADWCGPCKKVPSILKKVKKELNEPVRIVKVNVDRNPYIATRYKVQNLPTIMVFQKGNPTWKAEGICEPEEIMEVVQKQFSIK
jgi:thioredoxin 1